MRSQITTVYVGVSVFFFIKQYLWYVFSGAEKEQI
jgi:hypothetical protein